MFLCPASLIVCSSLEFLNIENPACACCEVFCKAVLLDVGHEDVEPTSVCGVAIILFMCRYDNL